MHPVSEFKSTFNTLLATHFGRKNYGRLIIGHRFSHFRQISDTFLKHCLSTFTPTKHELEWENVREMIVLLHP